MTIFEGIIAVIGCAAIFIVLIAGIQLFTRKVMGVEITSRSSYSATKTRINWEHKKNLSDIENYSEKEIIEAQQSLNSKFLANTSENVLEELIEKNGVKENKKNPLINYELLKSAEENVQWQMRIIERRLEREKKSEEDSKTLEDIIKKYEERKGKKFGE